MNYCGINLTVRELGNADYFTSSVRVYVGDKKFEHGNYGLFITVLISDCRLPQLADHYSRCPLTISCYIHKTNRCDIIPIYI